MTTMNEQILKYLPDYKVLLCTLCTESHCVPPNSIAQHFQDLHSNSISKQQLKKLVKYVQTFMNVLMKPKEVQKITPSITKHYCGDLSVRRARVLFCV